MIEGDTTDVGPRLPYRDAAGTTMPAGWAYRLVLLMGLLLLGSFLSVLLHVTTVVGGTTLLAVGVGAALVAGVGMAGRVPVRAGLWVAGALFGLGLGGYLLAVPDLAEAVRSLELFADFVALLLGEMSILQIFRADLWAVLMAPAPVYATAYLLLQRQYSLGVWVGGAALLFVVLTGDASEAAALVGVTGAVGVLGFGTLEESGATWQQVRDVGILLASIVVVTRLSRPVIGGLTTPRRTGVAPAGSDGPSTRTLEGSLVGTPDRIDIQGSVTLTRALRFTVRADHEAFWHVGAFDRFTGRGWVRSGQTTPYSASLHPPPGETETVEQRVTAEAAVTTMPAAWRPVAVDDAAADGTHVTELGGLAPTDAFAVGDAFSVTSERPTWTADQLHAANGDPSPSVRRRYLQLPSGTPDRLGRFAEALTSDAETRFEKAVLVERWLESNKEYSLAVTRPAGNVADAFVFEMDRGYCVYFATAMTVLLRTLGIPARFVVGYTPGQPVGDGTWEVRGFNSHAWVQVRFPDIGWVEFDPTPHGPRQEVRARQFDEARATAAVRPDTEQVAPGPETPTTPANASRLAAEDDGDAVTADAEATPDFGELGEELRGANQAEDEAGPTRRDLFTTLSGSDQLAIGAAITGVLLGATRLSLLYHGYQAIAYRWQRPTDSPQRDIERAFVRLEWVLARLYRRRRPGETRRSYIDAIAASADGTERLRRILRAYERARYQGEVSREQADEVISLVDAFVRDPRIRFGSQPGPPR